MTVQVTVPVDYVELVTYRVLLREIMREMEDSWHPSSAYILEIVAEVLAKFQENP